MKRRTTSESRTRLAHGGVYRTCYSRWRCCLCRRWIEYHETYLDAGGTCKACWQCAAPFSTELHRSPASLSPHLTQRGLSSSLQRGGRLTVVAALPAFFGGGLGGGVPVDPGNLLGLVAAALVLAVFGLALWLIVLEVVRSRRRRAELARVGRRR